MDVPHGTLAYSWEEIRANGENASRQYLFIHTL